MPEPKIINIDNKEYPIDTLSDVAKTQLMNLRVVDREIARLQTQLTIAQTARSVFARTVKSNLPETPAEPETPAAPETE